MTLNTFLILATVLAVSSCASALFWGTTEQTTPQPPGYVVLQGPGPVYALAKKDEQQVSSVPMEVPYQGQLQPHIGKVQLVPCLCPVSQDYPYDNRAYGKSIYVNHVPVQYFQHQPFQQQQPYRKR